MTTQPAFYIYTITHKTNLSLGQYIGSTSNFQLRRNNHKCFYQKGRHYNGIYQLIRDNGGWDDWEMKVITTADTHEKMRQIENTLIMNSNNVLNKRIAYVADYVQYKRQAGKKHYYSHLEQERRRARERYHKKKQCNNIDDSSVNQITSEGQTI